MENRFWFRAKRIDNGEWVEGYYCKWLKGKRVVTYSEKETDCIITWMSNGGMSRYEVDPSTICRCIGRTDRDEKLIFEHDVIAYLDTYSTESGYAEAGCTGEVVWDEETLSFQVTNRLSAESWEVLAECSVIGNAIDNPELLEV